MQFPQQKQSSTGESSSVTSISTSRQVFNNQKRKDDISINSPKASKRDNRHQREGSTSTVSTVSSTSVSSTSVSSSPPPTVSSIIQQQTKTSYSLEQDAERWAKIQSEARKTL